MRHIRSTIKSDDFVEMKNDGVEGAVLRAPIVAKEAVYIPATDFYLSMLGGSGGDQGWHEIVFMIRAGQAGLAVPFTPEQARRVATALNSAADVVEAGAAALAEAAIAKAKGARS